jgi:RHS repeat-associated protein
VEVSVVDRAGEPVAGAAVLAQDTSGSWVATSYTDAAGHADLGLDAGSYRFATMVGGYTFWSGEPGHCAVPGCTSAAITILTVQVSLLDGSGQPLTDQKVAARNLDGTTESNAYTDAQGVATVPLKPGAYAFFALVDDFYFSSGPLGHCEVPGCTSATIQVHEVAVTVSGAAGEPLPDQKVVAQDDGGNNVSNAYTDAQGIAHVPVEPGSYSFAIMVDNQLFTSGPPGHCEVPGCTSAAIHLLVDCSTRTDGTACNDGNACTQTDTCQAGACTGSNPVTCVAQDQCHDDGSCNAATGVCSNPPKANGTACDDGSACTQLDSCQSGACVGSNPVTCTARDQCHDAGTCDPSTGACSTSSKPDGTPCNDGDACTTGDACHAGVCAGTGTAASCGLTPTPIDPTVATDFAGATAFLYQGTGAVQTGMAPGTIDPRRASVARGLVTTRDGTPLGGVTVSVHKRPEFGQTQTRANGQFDMAVNGGETLTLDYAKEGFLPAQRVVDAPMLDYGIFPDVVLIPPDPNLTVINLPQQNGLAVAQGGLTSDDRGTRQAILLVAPGTTATAVRADGTTQNLPQITVRATEFTVGPRGLQTMPGVLPPTTAYTYALEYSVDEAMWPDVRSVQFSQPVVHYVENFLNFPVGSIVPTGYYDRDRASWVPVDNGQVIRVLDTAGLAELDTDGDGLADGAAALAALGITDAERGTIAQLYLPGDSVWRVPLTHLTTYDCNWLSRVQDPPDPLDPKKDDEEDPKCDDGSIIECENQVLGASVRVVGTNHQLAYNARRVPGYAAANTTTANLSGPNLPAGLRAIELEIRIAGTVRTQVFAPAPNLSTTVTWDGLDVYGRRLRGRQPAALTATYVYALPYGLPPPTAQQAFGARFSLVASADDAATFDLRVTRTAIVFLEVPDVAPLVGLGGWTISNHHSYDPRTRRLSLGTGAVRSADALPLTALPFAGTGVAGFSGDGGPAVAARIGANIGSLRAGPDGTLYFTDVTNRRIRRVSPDGIITTIAGTGPSEIDTTPASTQATAAALRPGPLALGSGPGSLLFVDTPELRTNLVRRLAMDGTIPFVAGNYHDSCFGSGFCDSHFFSGDLGPATDADLEVVTDIEIARDGALYILAGQLDASGNRVFRIRRVDADGSIRLVAGGDPGGIVPGARNIDGIALGPDGSIYFAVNMDVTIPGGTTHLRQIRRISASGEVTVFAGTDAPCPASDSLCFDEPSGDGVLATEARLAAPARPAFGPDGALYFIEQVTGDIRRVTPDGIISSMGAKVGPQAFTVAPDGSLYVVIPGAQIVHMAPALSGVTLSDRLVPSKDGQEIYVFDVQGRHLKTLDAHTNATKLQFGYAAGGLVTSIVDANGLITQVERTSGGVPTAIIAPGGQRTTLSLDGSGQLTGIANPAGQSWIFEYGNGGLLTSETDPAGAVHHFFYTDEGRLMRDERPGAGLWTLDRQNLEQGGTRVRKTSAEGRVSTFDTFKVGSGPFRHRVMVGPDGLARTTDTDAAGVETSTAPDGTSVRTTPAPDPRHGMAAPYVAKRQISVPAGPFMTITHARTASVNADSSLASQTDVVKVNNRTVTTVYDATSRTETTTSPMGRQRIAQYDTQGRIAFSQQTGLAGVTFGYDDRGRLASLSRGSAPNQRLTSFGYDASDRRVSSTNALSIQELTGYDDANFEATRTLGDGSVILLGHDPRGRLTSLTPAGRPEHRISYTPAGDEDTYTPPPVADTTGRQSHEYNLDRQLTTTTRADGSLLKMTYDDAGRPETMTYPAGPDPSDGQILLTRAYFPTTGQLSGLTTSDGQSLSYTYLGALQRDTTWSGTNEATVRLGYDSEMRVGSEDLITGVSDHMVFGYDNDDLLVSAGALTITRDPTTGVVTGGLLGGVADARTPNEFNETVDTQVTFGGSTLQSVHYLRDLLGRIADKTESITGVSSTYHYDYDGAGRLTQVTRNGVLAATYVYDANGNRTHRITADGDEAGSSDDQDRLVSFGKWSYTYTANGDLRTKTDTTTGAVTQYRYDALGCLRTVQLPDGRIIGYDIDPTGRRIAKRIDGVIVQRWVYSSPVAPAAELDSNGAVAIRFVAGSYLVKGGQTYRIIRDEVGSPRLIVNASTGAIAQRLDYDEWGRVLADSAPGFQPLGFAGGLYDRDTGLVRLGSRDYDPEVGRWLSKDKVTFDGGQANLYLYAMGDPLNRTDPLGFNPDAYRNDLALIKGFLNDLHTDDGSLILWGGDGKGANEEGALHRAYCMQKQTIRDTNSYAGIEFLIYNSADLTQEEQNKLWLFVSVNLVGQASGVVDAFANGVNMSSSILKSELDTAGHNDNVPLVEFYPAPENSCSQDCP